MDSRQIFVFLSPGEHFVGDARYRLRTLLGSCVSITLWQPQRRVGAMSHCLLADRIPAHVAGRSNGPLPLDGRYVAEALELMLQGLSKLGVAPTQCEAKLFGGGDMFPGQSTGTPVGRRNGEAAHALLTAYGIRVASYSLFGIGHRKIHFNIATGDVWARQEGGTTDSLTPGGVPVPIEATPPRNDILARAITGHGRLA